MATLIQCKGEGQGECTMCKEKYGFNRTWTSMLFKIDGVEGTYHHDCALKLLEDKTNG